MALRIRYRKLLDLADFQFDLLSSDMNRPGPENPYQGMGPTITIEGLWGNARESMVCRRVALPFGTRWSYPPGRRCHVDPFDAV